MDRNEIRRLTPKQRQAEADRRQGEEYHFDIAGHDYRLDPVDTLPASFFNDLRGMDDMNQTFVLVEALAPDQETQDAILALRGPEFRSWVRAWQSWQSVTVPES